MDTVVPDSAAPETNLGLHEAPPGRPDATGPQTATEELLEESLIADARAHLTPAQMVERKLVSLLKANPLPVSQVMAGSRTFRRR
jgi:hypothetical protein